jgi:hypothetical protein
MRFSTRRLLPFNRPPSRLNNRASGSGLLPRRGFNALVPGIVDLPVGQSNRVRRSVEAPVWRFAEGLSPAPTSLPVAAEPA